MLSHPQQRYFREGWRRKCDNGSDVADDGLRVSTLKGVVIKHVRL